MSIRTTMLGALATLATLLIAGCGRDPIGPLLVQLQSSNVEARRTAAREFGKLAVLDDRAIAALAGAAADGDVEVRRTSILALRRAGPAAATSVPALERALEDREAEVRQGAALAIGAIDPTNSRYQQPLIDAMRAAHGPAMLEVGKMGHGAAWAVPTLIPLLSHESAKVRALAARTLGQIGPVAESATSALKRASRDPHDAVKDAARAALEKIQGPSSSPPR